MVLLSNTFKYTLNGEISVKVKETHEEGLHKISPKNTGIIIDFNTLKNFKKLDEKFQKLIQNIRNRIKT